MVTKRISDALSTILIDEENKNPRARGDWQCFNTGSVEVEVGEFLYGLVRLLKPRACLETGTYHGVSAAYIGLALKRNLAGSLTTLDISPVMCGIAQRLVDNLEIAPYVRVLNRNAESYQPEGMLDLVFLDSEPQLRFSEFDAFYPHLAPGGLVVIHDLHWHLGLTWYRNNGMTHWPYGDFREYQLGEAIASHELQVMPFFTPRGLVVFQKAHPEFTHHLLLTEMLEEREPWP